MSTTIIKCDECFAQLRIPTDKYIKFACPECGKEYEFINGRTPVQIQKSKKKRKIFLYVLLTLAVVVAGLIVFKQITKPAIITETQAYAQKDSIWNDFREKYPYQFQMVGLEEYDDKSKLLIIAEPPTQTTVDMLNEFLKDYNYDLSIKTDSFGYDGWIKDIIICVNGLSDRKFKNFMSKLQTRLFYTDYKAYTIDLPIQAKSKSFLPYDLNYQISAAELQKWFIEDGEKLKKLNSQNLSYSNSKTLSDFFNPIDINGHFVSPDGIYYSERPGFVVWILPKNTSISDKKEEARQFSLDADLILGAISNKDYVAIIGREREISVLELPPLRIETIMMLATTENEHLAQSYERNHILAGKQKGGKDWAPILLSDELWNTEYGNLLNITDQILKSWSENGMVEYTGFEKYEKPFEWAFIKSALLDLNVNELTYNWNTLGTGYYVENEKYQIYAINRTGSLPVSYIPEDTEVQSTNKVYQAEEKAYDYFSNLNNPDLIRVVQYASLYQIFKNFNIIASETLNENNINSHVLEREAYNIYKIITKDSVSVENRFFTYYNYSLNKDQLDYIITNPTEKYKKELEDKMNNEILSQEKAQQMYDEYMEDFWSRKYPEYIKESQKIKSKLDFFRYFGEELINTDSIKTCYVNDNLGISATWIKCPTIVQSWNLLDSISWTGGHNLDAKITPFRVDRTLKAGEFKVVKDANGLKTVYIAESDLGKITPEVLRNIERTSISGVNKFSKNVSEIRPRTSVIPDNARPNNIRGFNSDSHLKIEKLENGFKIGNNTFKDNADVNNYVLDLIENKKSGTIIIEDYSANSIRTSIKNAEGKLIAEGLLKGSKNTSFGEAFRSVDFSKSQVEQVGNNVKIFIPDYRATSGKSGVKLSFSQRFKESILKIIDRLKNIGKRDPLQEFRKGLKEYGIPENEIKREFYQEIKEGKHANNTIKQHNYDIGINNKTNIA